MHLTFLEQALRLARNGEGECAPNPAVGAVVVRDGEIISRGYHKGPGTPHAEVAALEPLGELAEGSTVYVTLEPCCHHGRTPPCTDYLIQMGVRAVYFGQLDPNPQVSGQGQQALVAAGILCEQIESDSVAEFYEAYLHWWRHKRPFAMAKLAVSLDGKIAAQDGSPVKLTSAVADVFTHEQRKRSDALLTSVRTVLRDDPRMNVRLGGGTRSKKLFILDTRLEMPDEALVWDSCSEITLLHGPEPSETRLKSLISRGARCVPSPPLVDGKIPLDWVLTYLGDQGLHRVWIEVGGTLFEELSLNRLIQRGVLIFTPRWLGENGYSGLRESMGRVLGTDPHVYWKAAGRDSILFMEWD